MKTIGVLTSGGDAPGMNAAVRAVVRTAIANGIKVMGIRRGYCGLIDDDIIELDINSVSDIINRGGTILYSSRCPEFKTEEGMQKAISNCKKHGIEGMVVIGGDGSYRGARDMSLRGFPCVGVPGTIDNDISSTEYTIGFDTAMNTAMDMIDRLRDTTQSHFRCSVVEVMGHGAGDIAINTALAVGATACIVPEIPFNYEKDVIEKIEYSKANGKTHFIIVVSEGITDVTELAKKIEDETGIESRATILGHVQRGGSPTVRDRVAASTLGYEAVMLLKDGIGNRVVGFKDNKVVNYDIFEGLNMKKKFDELTYTVVNTTSL